MKNKVIKDFLNKRRNQTEFILIALSLCLGLVLLCNVSSYNHNDTFSIITGLILCSLSIYYFIIKISVVKNKKNIKGFIIIDNENNEIIPIENYDYVNNISRNLKSAIIEDNAIKIELENAGFKSGSDKEKKQKGIKIINELTEYYILNTISTHLTDYFNNNKIEKEKLVEFSRNDIPLILLNNRFLELFSKPIDKRPIFKKHGFKSDRLIIIKDSNKNLVSVKKVSQSNIFRFQSFKIVLPEDSKITKDLDGSIVIENKRIILKFKTIFEGNTVLPIGFEKYFLDLHDIFRYDAFQVNIIFEFKLKFGAVFLINRLDFWINSLIDKIEKKISKEKYFNKIEWDKTFVILKSLEKANVLKK
ncbi:hypothetical protein KKA87_04650 [bacterium]|nr:hypothetical protein [bacterium]